ATHSHAAPDFIGGWGFVPDWYMAQVTDTIKKTVKQAVLAAQPARLTAGEVEARRQNSERRDTYRSAEEQQLGWLRAVDRKGHAIATIGAYAAHPTTKGNNGGIASADWPGLFAKTLEERDGGIAMHLQTGLGNISASGGTAIGTQLAALVPTSGGRPIDGTLRLARTTFRSALTNVPLDALGTPGFFDRKFDAQPVAVSVGENPNAPCASASAQSVELPLTVASLGDWVLTTGPGEEFSNLSNTIKEKNTDAVVFPVSQANDALGYMPQSFELNPVGQQGLGFALGGYVFVNYEDSYAVDRCVGDLALETTLTALNTLQKG
ncbi:MAG: primase, partial [Frankiales bacterium]|nr:primase [Frankiales bacterium]